jgi:hypothetical protein
VCYIILCIVDGTRYASTQLLLSGGSNELGYVPECKWCHSSYLTWKFVVDADYYVVEFSVTVRTIRLVIARCVVSGM